jgi:hypothetical protein
MTSSEAKEDLNKQIKDMQEIFKKRAQTEHTNLSTQIAKSCMQVENTAKRKMTNAATDSDISYGKRGHHPSVPGSAPAVDAGTLRRSVTHDVTSFGGAVEGHVGSTIVDPPYGSYLENGTSKMQPRPWLIPSLDENIGNIRANVKQAVVSKDFTVNDISVEG